MSQMPGTGMGYQYNQTGVVNDPLVTNPGPTGGNTGPMGMGMGYMGYMGQSQNQGGLPGVSNPDQAYEAITRGEYFDFVSQYGDYEKGLIDKAKNDTGLIDQAREDVSMASGLTKGIADRNASRYGASLTPAQMQQQGATLQRSNTLGGIQAVGDARIAQREANTGLMSDLINIGQGVNRASQSQMGSAAADATARQNAYTQAKATSKANTYSTIGSLGAMAIMAFAF
jgi:hypothetical protein